jgi:hypothetical protein
MLRTLPRLWAALALLLLAACGANGSPGSTPAATQPTPSLASTQPSSASPATAQAAPTTGVQATTPPITAAPAPTAGQSGIPEGTTAEGYHVLGRADAPVTLVMYSDFL